MSDHDCRNDCTLPLRFPRRPGTEPITSHGDDCLCCSPIEHVSQDNRPALPRFNYRIGTYGSIREFLFHQINKMPELKNWTHRTPDDPAVALLEGASILGDILTFYQEAYANEAFLRTASWRESIADLVRLLGYRLSPTVGGNAVFAFEIKKDEPVIVPAGFPVTATLEKLPKPAEFETLDEITAYPWLSRFNLFRPMIQPDITPTTNEFYLTLPNQLLSPIELKAGERLLLGESTLVWPTQPRRLENAEIVIVDSVRELHGTKIYKIKGGLKRNSNIDGLTAYRIGRTFHHFGSNSQEQIVDTSKPVKSKSTVTEATSTTPAKTETSSIIPYLDVPFTRPVANVSGTFSNSAVSPSLKNNEFPLETEVKDIPNNVPIALQARFAYPGIRDIAGYTDVKTLVRTISKIEPVTITWGGVSGNVSQITVDSPIANSVDPASQLSIDFARDDADLAVSDANSKLAAAIAARTDARNKRATAKEVAAAALSAKEEAARAATKADVAKAEAATLAVSYAIAAAAKKDDATDAAAQAAVTAAINALAAITSAKADADKTSTDAAASAAAANTSKSGAETAANGFLFATIVDPAAAGAARAVYDAAKLNVTKTAADLAKNDAEAGARSAANALSKSQMAKDAADAVKATAAADADATERARLAKKAADDAKNAADLAAGEAIQFWNDALIAENDAILAVQTADAAELAADLAEAAAEEASHIAGVKNILRDTRIYIRDALFHEVTSPLMVIKAAKTETSAVSGNELNFYGTADEVKTLKDRQIMIDKPDGEPYLRNVSQVPSLFLLDTARFRQLHPIRLSESVNYRDFPNLGPLNDVFGNLADANEGKTMPEVPIGSGDAMQIFQNFKLPKAPLTYHLVPENMPSETPELEIYVDGRQWTQVDSFFDHGKDEHIYIVRQDADGNSWVQFGDGKTGARLTNGVNNVTAIYRIGDGAFGALKEDTKVQASAKLKNLDKIQMPMDATGGAEPEDGDNARNAAPGKVQSLGRIVSLRDYEAEALAIPGVVSAAAAWRLRGNIPTVVVTVLMETGRAGEIDTVNRTLNNYDDERGAARNTVIVDGGKRKYVAIAVEYALKPSYRSDLVEPVIRRALGVNYAKPNRQEDQTGLFSLRRRRFGGREYASTIEGWVQNVDGVLWAEVTAFASLPEDGDDPTTIPLPSSTASHAVVQCDVGQILSLYDAHLTLKNVKGVAG